MLLRSIAAGSLRTRSSFPYAFSGNPGETYNLVALAPSADCASFCALSARVKNGAVHIELRSGLQQRANRLQNEKPKCA